MDLLLGDEPLAEHAFECDGHRAGGLSGADDGDAFDGAEIDDFVANDESVAVDVDALGDQPLGLHFADAGPPNTLGVGTELRGRTSHAYVRLSSLTSAIC
jgi:hypothetical protein